ncbi:MAG: DNA methyltransferase [Candidatus Limnocylindrales bacterium]
MDATLTPTTTRTRRAPRSERTGEAPASSPESIAPELRSFVVPIGSLTFHPRNPRHGNLEAITGSLRRFGQLRPVLVQRSTGFIVAGNHVVRAAGELGWQNLAAVVVDLDDATASAYLLADNRTADLSTYDDALLAALLEEQAATGNLTGIGYGRDDIDELVARVLAEAERKGDPDAIPEPPADGEVYVHRGERWRLGRHTLLCGDATDPADVARLLAGATPTLLSSDPPYGVSLDVSWRDGVVGPSPRGGRGKSHRTTTLAGDTRVDWSEAFALVPSLQVGYVWHAAIHAATVAAGLERIGFEIVSQVIWDKGLFALGRSWYQWMHEPAWVVRKRGAKVGFFGARNQATIWRAPSPKMVAAGSSEASLDHPTQKPVLLSEIPIANHLRGSDSVYDPFVGSGTTLIAAERLGRRCFAMEIDPKFAQLTIERWQTYTGERAVREDVA